jgi:pimeloyl-ACP methyl ester carboxylesterase
VLRWTPPALAAYGGAFALDVIRTVPLVGDPRQALKLGSRAGRSMELHVTRPWRALGPGQAILRAGSSVPLLERVHAAGTYVAVVHGDRDVLVPIAAGRDTARRVDGDFVVVRGGGHSWLLRCPETLPAIVAELRRGRLGEAIDGHAGSALQDDALVVTLGTAQPPEAMRARRAAPAYRWRIENV